MEKFLPCVPVLPGRLQAVLTRDSTRLSSARGLVCGLLAPGGDGDRGGPGSGRDPAGSADDPCSGRRTQIVLRIAADGDGQLLRVTAPVSSAAALLHRARNSPMP